MFEIDQTVILSKVDTPLLLVQAGMDKNVSVSLAAAQADAISKNNPNIIFKKYDELDHSFKRPDGASGVDKVLQYASLWLSQH
jgi:hypothetical protein